MSAGDQLRIDTPEQVALELPIAGIGSRFLALAIDTLIQVCAFLIVLLAVTVTALLQRLITTSGGWLTLAPALLVLFTFCLYWGYFATFELFWKGQTPGKRVAGIRVIKDTGRPVDALAAILRNLLRAIDFLPGLYATGVVCMIFNRHSRRLGDLAAGTVVVHDQALSDRSIEWEFRQPPRRPSSDALAAQSAALNDAELVLVESYLARRIDLTVDAQDRVARQIATRLKDRLGIQPEPGQSVDDFLEAVARHARDGARFR